MRKLFSLVVLMLVFLGACGDSGTGPDNSFVGTYSLDTINGNKVPYAIIQIGNDKLEIVSGQVTINSDDTFSGRTTIRTTESGRTTTEEESFTGTYSRNNNAFTFTDNEGDSYTGSVQGGMATLNIEGLILVYRK